MKMITLSTATHLQPCQAVAIRFQRTVSQQTIDIAKATAPIIREHGEKITERMYQLAFQERPDYKLGFQQSFMKHLEGGGQARKLANIFIEAEQKLYRENDRKLLDELIKTES